MKLTLKKIQIESLKHINKSKQFIKFLIQNFIDDDCTYRASALTFTSLLAVVPLMSVSFAILTTFPVFEQLLPTLQNFIFENFVPSTGKVIQSYLLSFSSQVSKLSIWGVAFLFVTAVLLMFTIEKAMNRIWKVRGSRDGTTAILLYWSILSLTPLLIGLSLAASSYIFTLPFIGAQHGISQSTLIQLAPILLSLVAFTFLYTIVPNCKVKLRHSVPAALLATISFEIAKVSFSWYLTQFNTYELLYGAFATIPLFFLWVYWVWLIILLGAEFSYALASHYQRRGTPPIDGFTMAVHFLYYLWLAKKKASSLSFHELLEKDKNAYEIEPAIILESLFKNGFIIKTDKERYFLSKDLSDYSLFQLYKLLPYPYKKGILHTDLDKKLNTIYANAEEKTKSIFDISLKSLFSEIDKHK